MTCKRNWRGGWSFIPCNLLNNSLCQNFLMWKQLFMRTGLLRISRLVESPLAFVCQCMTRLLCCRNEKKVDNIWARYYLYKYMLCLEWISFLVITCSSFQVCCTSHFSDISSSVWFVVGCIHVCLTINYKFLPCFIASGPYMFTPNRLSSLKYFIIFESCVYWTICCWEI